MSDCREIVSRCVIETVLKPCLRIPAERGRTERHASASFDPQGDGDQGHTDNNVTQAFTEEVM